MSSEDRCFNCGVPLINGNLFCTACGARVDGTRNEGNSNTGSVRVTYSDMEGVILRTYSFSYDGCREKTFEAVDIRGYKRIGAKKAIVCFDAYGVPNQTDIVFRYKKKSAAAAWIIGIAAAVTVCVLAFVFCPNIIQWFTKMKPSAAEENFSSASSVDMTMETLVATPTPTASLTAAPSYEADEAVEIVASCYDESDYVFSPSYFPEGDYLGAIDYIDDLCLYNTYEVGEFVKGKCMNDGPLFIKYQYWFTPGTYEYYAVEYFSGLRDNYIRSAYFDKNREIAKNDVVLFCRKAAGFIAGDETISFTTKDGTNMTLSKYDLSPSARHVICVMTMGAYNINDDTYVTYNGKSNSPDEVRIGLSEEYNKTMVELSNRYSR